MHLGWLLGRRRTQEFIFGGEVVEIKDKVVMITGASSGIGLAIAKSLATEGAKLVLAARSEEKLARAAVSLGELGATVLAVSTDVTREADCQAVVQKAMEQFGAVDVLVNNAGYSPPASLLETTEEIWDVTVNVCLKGVYLMSRAAVSVMIPQGGGTIINLSSVAGKTGYENRSAYCAAKWGVHGFTEALKVELAAKNIRLHLICPGAVATPWWGNTNDVQPDEVMARMIQAEEVAEAVRWVLAQPERVQIDELVIKTYRSPWVG